MAGRRDDHQLIAQKGNHSELGILEGGPDDRQVQLAAQDLLLDPGAGSYLQRDHQARVQLLECT